MKADKDIDNFFGASNISVNSSADRKNTVKKVAVKKTRPSEPEKFAEAADAIDLFFDRISSSKKTAGPSVVKPSSTSKIKVTKVAPSKSSSIKVQVTGPSQIPKYIGKTPATIAEQMDILTAGNKHKLTIAIQAENYGRINLTLSEVDRNAQQWEVATEIARSICNVPPDDDKWRWNCDLYFLAMIDWCIEEIKRSGNYRTGYISQYPLDALEVYWPRPKIIDMNERTMKLRDVMTMRVMDYFRKAVAYNREQGFEVNLGTKSYRRVLAAQELHDAIEAYASNWRMIGMDQYVDDSVLENRCQQAARKYFKAHCPIPSGEIKPGPIDTLDPDYFRYRQLCRDYDLTVGTLLHKVITRGETSP